MTEKDIQLKQVLCYLKVKYQEYQTGLPKDTVKNVAKLRLLRELYTELESGEYKEVLSSYNSLKKMQNTPKPDLSFPVGRCIPVPVEIKNEEPKEVLKKSIGGY